MQARPVAKEAAKKPAAAVKASACHPLTFAYAPAPSGVDSNLLILLHGLGDTHVPFESLGRKLATNLPQTAILSLRGGSPVPFLEVPGWGWWEVWDSLGQEVPSPNLSAFLAAFKRLLDYLTKDVANGGCGWPSSSIHLFGFGQGGAAAMEGAIAWTREQRGEAKICEVGSEMGSKIGSELGSVVDICGALASAPLLHFHRESIETSAAKGSLATLRKAFANVQEASFPSPQREAMPQSQAEWTAIMTFWSKVVRNRSAWELQGDVFSVGEGTTR